MSEETDESKDEQAKFDEEVHAAVETASKVLLQSFVADSRDNQDPFAAHYTMTKAIAFLYVLIAGACDREVTALGTAVPEMMRTSYEPDAPAVADEEKEEVSH
jgi:hypothetical protein